MAQITLKGTATHTCGELPAVGQKAPDFTLVATDLSEKTLRDYAGKKKVLSVNPSLDTGVCQATARQFNASLGGRGDVVVLAISADLPFALKRACEVEGIDNAVTLSSFRSSFGTDFGVEFVDGPLRGLTARAVVVLDEDDTVLWTQLVSEITTEPDYEAATRALG